MRSNSSMVTSGTDARLKSEKTASLVLHEVDLADVVVSAPWAVVADSVVAALLWVHAVDTVQASVVVLVVVVVDLVEATVVPVVPLEASMHQLLPLPQRPTPSRTLRPPEVILRH